MNQEEIIELDEAMELETLILQGNKAQIPIIIDYPTADGKISQVACKIRPLNNIEWNNAIQKGFQNSYETNSNIEIVKRGLLTKDGDGFPPELVEKMAGGVVNTIAEEIARVSGIKFDKEENIKYAKELMGF